MHDIVRSPKDDGHVYEIRPPYSEGSLLAPKGVDSVDIITPEGAQRLSADQVNADALRLRPKLLKTTPQIIAAANARWQLDRNSKEANNG